MSGLTKPIDVRRPEDYQLRDGKEVIALAKYKNGDILVLCEGGGEPFTQRLSPNGGRFDNLYPASSLDLIEKPKKMWKNLYENYYGSLWFESKSDADSSAGGSFHRTGYLVCTDPNDFSTYELVPLEGEI